jgi:hypothetical protein
MREQRAASRRTKGEATISSDKCSSDSHSRSNKKGGDVMSMLQQLEDEATRKAKQRERRSNEKDEAARKTKLRERRSSKKQQAATKKARAATRTTKERTATRSNWKTEAMNSKEKGGGDKRREINEQQKGEATRKAMTTEQRAATKKAKG